MKWDFGLCGWTSESVYVICNAQKVVGFIRFNTTVTYELKQNKTDALKDARSLCKLC